MFNKKFKVKVIRTDCNAEVTIYMNGKRSRVNENIERLKEMSERYMMFGRSGMVIWTNRAI